MNTNGQVISNVFNDKNINKDERYMFLMFISMIKEAKDEIAISITTLMDAFQTKCKKKILGTLKSLENKGYIEIIKSIGKINKYRVIKSYVNTIANNFNHGKKENHYSDEKHYNGDCYNKNTSSNREPGKDITSGNLDTSSYISSSNIDTGSKITSGYNDTGRHIEPGSNDYEKYAKNKGNRAFDEDLVYLEHKEYNYSLNNNKNNIYINNNKLYINIFNSWNETGISNEKILYPSIKAAIEYAINLYGENEIIVAIKNYSEIYYSDHYYDYNWSLVSFLRKENGVKRFLNDGDIWRNYSCKLHKEREEEKFKINIEDYIY